MNLETTGSGGARGVNPLFDFSEQIAALIDGLGRHVVAVHVSRRESVSGTVWREGVIVTVAHALRASGEIAVTLPDGRQAKAEVAGADVSTDLAVLRINESTLAAAPLGDASKIRTGHWTLAIARGAHGDVAADQGIVGRAGPAWQTWRGGTIDRFIRLDGGLSPGFSGAPIADAQGRVVGIGTAALARGYGIVIPVATVNRVAEALLTKGRVARGYVGIGAQPVELPSSIKQTLKLDASHGLLIAGIADDSPAERAGWLIGDILLSLDNDKLHDIDSLLAALGDRVGEKLRARSVRGGALIETDVTVGERPRRHC